MKTLLQAVFACAAAILLAGCGQLRVQVDVLDREYVRAESTEETLRQAYRRVMADAPGTIALRIDRKFADYQREVFKLTDKYEALAKTLPDPQKQALTDIAHGLRRSIRQGTPALNASRTASDLESRASGVRADSAGHAWSGRKTIPAGLRQRLVELEAASKNYDAQLDIERRTISEDVTRLQHLAKPDPGAVATPVPESVAAKDVKAQEAVVASVIRRSIIEGSELSDTEYAHLIAAAPPDLWTTNYNRALGSGTFGNIDVVIRMNSTADFSVKGMRFDATTVAAVASKVLTQSVLLGAQIAGVPVSTASTGSTGGEALSRSSAELAAADASIAAREASIEAQRTALRSLAKTILAARTQMEAPAFKTQGPDARAPVHAPIDSTLDAMRPLLTMQGLQ